MPGRSHVQRSLVGCSPWDRKESDTPERLHFHFSLSCIGEGNGNPLQCSCLENPGDGGAWWAAVSGVAQNRTGLKRLSSNSSSNSVSTSIPISSSCHPPLPLLCPHVLSLYLHLYFCLGNTFICTAFLDSTCMHSVQFSHSVVSDSLRPHESQHARPPCPSPSPGVHSDLCPLSR